MWRFETLILKDPIYTEIKITCTGDYPHSHLQFSYHFLECSIILDISQSTVFITVSKESISVKKSVSTLFTSVRTMIVVFVHVTFKIYPRMKSFPTNSTTESIQASMIVNMTLHLTQCPEITRAFRTMVHVHLAIGAKTLNDISIQITLGGSYRSCSWVPEHLELKTILTWWPLICKSRGSKTLQSNHLLTVWSSSTSQSHSTKDYNNNFDYTTTWYNQCNGQKLKFDNFPWKKLTLLYVFHNAVLHEMQKCLLMYGIFRPLYTTPCS